MHPAFVVRYPKTSRSVAIQHFIGSMALRVKPRTRQRDVEAECWVAEATEIGQPLVLSGQNSLARSQSCCRSPRSSNQDVEMAEERRQGKTLGGDQRLALQLVLREKNLRNRPPLFRGACPPIPISPWFRGEMMSPCGCRDQLCRGRRALQNLPLCC